jgi:hypothetical protein
LHGNAPGIAELGIRELGESRNIGNQIALHKPAGEQVAAFEDLHFDDKSARSLWTFPEEMVSGEKGSNGSLDQAPHVRSLCTSWI